MRVNDRIFEVRILWSVYHLFAFLSQPFLLPSELSSVIRGQAVYRSPSILPLHSMVPLQSILFFVVLVVAAKEEYRTVTTTFGAVRGRRIFSYGGHEGFSFLGIPSAKPPVGALRWKEAQDPDEWTSVLDTLTYRNACISDPKKTYKNAKGGPVSEDCLYTYVFSSRKCLGKGGCAVMAVIHGGGHKTDSPAIYRQDVVINNFANEERNVVVVFIPYRIGPMGNFQLTEGTKTSADTCIEIRDCIFGLRWIQREISAFGGDPKRVTVLGHSAGAVSVQQISLLPVSSDLFSQIISMSRPGTGGDLSRTVNVKYSRELTKLLGCAHSEELFTDLAKIEKIMQCMRNKSDLDILGGIYGMYSRVENQWSAWVDGEIFPRYERDLLKALRRPLNILLGSTSAETRSGRYIKTETGEVNTTRLYEVCSVIGYWRNYERPERFVDACVKFYSKGRKKRGFKTLAFFFENRVDFLEDDVEYYIQNTQYADQITRVGGKAYFYSYAYSGAKNVWGKYNSPNYVGPAHTEDYIYIFGVYRNDSQMKEKDFVIERKYSGMLANFVNTGDPTYQGQTWETWDSKRRNFFEIDFDENQKMPGMKDDYWLRAKEFFEEMAVREGGEWTPLEDFPQEADCLMVSDLINGFKGMWKNMSYDKTLNATQGIYRMAIGHVEKLRKEERLKESAKTRSLTEDADGKVSSGDWLTLLMAAAPLVLVVSIGFWKFREYRRRRNYTLISD